MSYTVSEFDKAIGSMDYGGFQNHAIMTGIVVEEVEPKNTGETEYLVLANHRGNQVPMYCRRMSGIGGAHNYEEYNLHGYTESPIEKEQKFKNLAGDTVIVAALSGNMSNGIILGGIRHPAREEVLEANGKSAYSCRINGILKEIDEDGALTFKFLGNFSANEAILSTPAGLPIQEFQEYPTKAGTFFGFDADGNFEASDGDSVSIKLTRGSTANVGDIAITAGSTTVTLAGNSGTQEVTISTEGEITISSDDNMTANAEEITINANKSMKLEAEKSMNLVSNGVDLVELLVELLDELGLTIVTSPNGPCSKFNEAPTWSKIQSIQDKLKKHVGS